ncbi:hypothetical protein ELI52_17140 [Rhizobium ruizarguesonis]|nr:hypothetical protein ELI52_17140 [Rhizobium ruizarguesonis]
MVPSQRTSRPATGFLSRDRKRTDQRRGSSCPCRSILHNSLNRNRFKDKITQQFKVLQSPLRV